MLDRRRYANITLQGSARLDTPKFVCTESTHYTHLSKMLQRHRKSRRRRDLRTYTYTWAGSRTKQRENELWKRKGDGINSPPHHFQRPEQHIHGISYPKALSRAVRETKPYRWMFSCQAQDRPGFSCTRVLKTNQKVVLTHNSGHATICAVEGIAHRATYR